MTKSSPRCHGSSTSVMTLSFLGRFKATERLISRDSHFRFFVRRFGLRSLFQFVFTSLIACSCYGVLYSVCVFILSHTFALLKGIGPREIV